MDSVPFGVALAAAVFGLVAWIAFRGLRSPLTIGERGILDRRSGLGRIRWADVAGAWVARTDGILVLRLRPDCPAGRRLARRGLPVEVRIDPAREGIEPVEVLRRVVGTSGAA